MNDTMDVLFPTDLTPYGEQPVDANLTDGFLRLLVECQGNVRRNV